MKHIITLLLAILCLLLAGQTQAQVEVRLDPVRREFLLGENVALKLTILNNTDKAITFHNTPGRNWLNFTINKNRESHPISPKALPRFPKTTIGPGSRISRQINLGEFFLSTATAHIRQSPLFVCQICKLPSVPIELGSLWQTGEP